MTVKKDNMKEDEYVNVFVYGTLKRDKGNHNVMEQADGRFIDEAYIYGMQLKEMGVPFIDFGDCDSFVFGEVYEVPVNKLGIIDALEGFSETNSLRENMYLRLQKNVKLKNSDDIVNCYFYMINGEDGFAIEENVF